MKLTEKNPNHLPTFSNREEEAAVWDKRDLGDFWEEAELAPGDISKQLSTNFTVRLSPAMLKRLREHAERKGLAPSTLARMWLVERLHEVEASKARQSS
jgi:hypothetical protein